ncbi:hypothetical protein [Streptomyces atratus]|uniref:hypothetical protein n=1 Tax=Streptomyces atratus TaxID=1893 RepID=UPI003400DE79
MAESAPEGAPDTATDEGPVIGKRYADEESGLQVMCTHGGSGALSADGRPLELLGARQLPASD